MSCSEILIKSYPSKVVPAASRTQFFLQPSPQAAGDDIFLFFIISCSNETKLVQNNIYNKNVQVDRLNCHFIFCTDYPQYCIARALADFAHYRSDERLIDMMKTYIV